MRRVTSTTVTGLFLTGGLLVSQVGFAQNRGGPRFEVAVTNLTRGQTFTPVLVASHRDGVSLFTLGQPASAELAILAEEGNTGPLAGLLLVNPGVRDVADSGPPPAGFVLPGQSKTVTVETGGGSTTSVSRPC